MTKEEEERLEKIARAKVKKRLRGINGAAASSARSSLSLA
jgi:hypothetical protein